jgi:L-2-hydroxyglutarate oxidase LhgO
VASARKLLPELAPGDVVRGQAGIRAQALAADGSLVDDFVFEQSGRVLHVRNAPSPGATSSLPIGERIADMAVESFGLVA